VSRPAGMPEDTVTSCETAAAAYERERSAPDREFEQALERLEALDELR
jgi:hypothetical protein